MKSSSKEMNSATDNMVAYLPATTVLVELTRMVSELAELGVTPDRTAVGGSFAQWSAQCEAGQTVWIYTLEQFRSIIELMGYYESMRERGVTIRSVKEPWFNNPEVSGPELLGHLFRLGESIHSQLLPTTPVVVRRSGKESSGLPAQTVAKVKVAIDLRATRKLSVVSACRMAGCGVNAYYRYLKAHQQEI